MNNKRKCGIKTHSMSLHEHITPANDSDEIELSPQLETAVDQGIYDYATATMIASGARPTTSVSTGIPRQRSLKTGHVSHRGGRSYPEARDSELDENWNVTFQPLSDEQKKINERGVALARRALAVHKFDEEVRTARALGIPVMALQRARADKAARERSDAQ